MHRKKEKAFTLIELLVVIAIIALLLSISMPGLRKARDQARAVVCRSNCKQWSVTILLYTQDNDQKFWPDGWGGVENWMDTLGNIYGDNNEFRQCPSGNKDNSYFDPTRHAAWHGSSTEAGMFPRYDAQGNWLRDKPYKFGYGINHWVNTAAGRGWRDKPECQWEKITAVVNSNDVPLLGDCTWYGGNPETFDRGMIGDPATEVHPSWPGGYNVPTRPDYVQWRQYGGGGGSNQDDMARFAINRHDKKMNLCFMDGSARAVPLVELWQLKWHKKSRPNYDADGRIQNILDSWLK